MPDPKEVDKKEAALKEYAKHYKVRIGDGFNYSSGIHRPGEQLA